MRLNTSIFHTVLCLGAILHAACGSPVPPSTQTGHDDVPPGNSPAVSEHDAAPPSYRSAVGVHDAAPPSDSPAVGGPSLSIVSSAESLPSYDKAFDIDDFLRFWKSQPLVRSTEFAPVIDNHIEAGLTFFGPMKLASFIPEFRTHPDRRHIHFNYPGQRPFSIEVSQMNSGRQYLECYFYFGPVEPATSGTETFRGLGYLIVRVDSGKADFGSSSMWLILEVGGKFKAQMRIGSARDFHFVNPDPNDHLGAGLVVERNPSSGGKKGVITKDQIMRSKGTRYLNSKKFGLTRKGYF
ncbi:hypothetical protein C8R42DRAFT_678933 [Lentinula raphanica]|nr:hypothetical protein C8R42DRAFT_678933 [Lentinula raphanica]